MSTPIVAASALAVALGTAAGLGRAHVAVVATWVVLGALVVTVLMRRSAAATVLIVLTLGTAAAANGAWRSAAGQRAVLRRLASEGTEVRACGTVMQAGPRSLLMSAREVRAGSRVWRVREPVRVATGPRIRPGERACAAGDIKPSRKSGEPPLLVASNVRSAGIGSPVRLAAGAVRARFSAAARRVMPARQAGLLLGMTDGDTELLDDATMEAFRTTGLAHLVAVSGANVAIVLALVLFGVRLLLRRGRWLRAAIAVPPLVLFAFLTNLEASVLRATVSAGIVLAVTASGRRTEGLRATAIAFVALVLWSPEMISSVGFQLSFAATLGLVLWAGPLTEGLARLFAGGKPGRAATVTAAAVGTTLAAQIAVAPLLAWHFGRIPAFGGLANLLVVPLAPVVTVGGLVTLGLASVWSGFAWAPALLRLPIDGILAAARGFAAMPGASVEIGPHAGAALVAGAAALWSRGPRVRAVAFAMAIAASAASCGQQVAGGGRCEGPEVRVLDVGQGTAVLLRDGPRTALVDGGPAAGRVVRALRDAGVRSLDVAVISHPHADHTEGLVDTIRRMRVGRLVGAANMDWGVGRELVTEARRRRVPVTIAAAGDSIAVSPRLRLEVLSPEPGPPPEPSEDAINALSLVVRATVGGMPVLLPGDIDAEGSAALLESGRHAQAPVLIAPHHGSADLDRKFVDSVDPRLTIVTVGQNRYGHPTRRALKIYRETGAVLRTDTDGAIGVCVGADGAEVVPAR